MARLPIPGSDSGTWGTLLNDFLSQAHDSSGALKINSVAGAVIQDGVVSEQKLDTATQTKLANIGAKVIVLDSGDPVPGGTPTGTVILRRP